MARRRPIAAAACALAAASLLAGCFTGKRPHFDDEPQRFSPGSATGDAGVDALLSRLDALAAGPATFTAGYDVLLKFGIVASTATVTVDGERRAVDFGTVRYVEVPGRSTTCFGDASSPTCKSGLDAARVSATGVTVNFYAAEAATRLRRDMASRIGPAELSSATIAGLAATCVSVPQVGIAEQVADARYCVLESGLLARIDDGDVAVTLTAYSATADPAAFAG